MTNQMVTDLRRDLSTSKSSRVDRGQAQRRGTFSSSLDDQHCEKNVIKIMNKKKALVIEIIRMKYFNGFSTL